MFHHNSQRQSCQSPRRTPVYRHSCVDQPPPEIHRMATHSIRSGGHQPLGMAQLKASRRFTPALRNRPPGESCTSHNQGHTGSPASDPVPGNGNGIEAIKDDVQHQTGKLPRWERNIGCLMLQDAACPSNCTHALKITPAVRESHSGKLRRKTWARRRRRTLTCVPAVGR